MNVRSKEIIIKVLNLKKKKLDKWREEWKIVNLHTSCRCRKRDEEKKLGSRGAASVRDRAIILIDNN